MQNENKGNRKYVFVCGLQRSGTSVLARNIGRLEDCTSFKNTGALQDEGQYLQEIYPPDGEYGGTGRFGFDARAHLTETSPLLTPENIGKLRRSWHSHWDKDKSICLEKTPGNLIMTRFLQAAFPNAYFIVIRRHPVPVSMATQRWKVSLTSLHSQFEHWLRCYGIFEEDKKYLKHVYELAYEDYTINPAKYHQEIAAFIGTRIPEATGDANFRYVAQWRNPMGLRVPEGTMEEVTGAYNKKYFDRWSNLLNNSPFKNYYRYVARKYESRFAKYGYSLTRESDTAEEARRHEGRAPAAIGTLYCIGADVGCLIVRCARWSIWRIKKGLRAALPKPLRIRIKHVLQKVSVGKGRTDAVSS